jgi:tetratricopeptide (TPR) repeat protein
MAGPSRIDELRKKFDENPRRYFAPLANEYRKLGDFDQAIFICQEFLPQQPGHMSGHIVYGQALFEAGRHDEARTVFETALALDPENLIALRHLGDIARAHGDSETARAWYRRVLESDPRNEEIAGILSSLDTEEMATPPVAMQPDAATSEAGASTSAEPLETQTAMGSAAPELAIPASSDPVVDEPLTSAPSETTFDELAKLFTTSEAAPAPPADDESLGLIHEGEDVLSHASQAIVDAAVAGKAPAAPSPEPAAAESPTFSVPFLETLGTAEPPPTPAAPAPREEPAAEAEKPSDSAAAFVTETMAELYLRQGHHELAVDVYRKLIALRPDDAALRARLRELEAPSAPAAAPRAAAAAEAGPTIREFLASIADFRLRGPQGDASERSEQGRASAATETIDSRTAAPNGEATVGTSLHSLFADAEGRLATENVVSPGPTAPADLPLLDTTADQGGLRGRPATQAATELSLDHVFRHATPASGTGTPSSFSFDQFFSQQAHRDSAPAESESPAEGSGGSSDDIQQFNAWLEGLKKS